MKSLSVLLLPFFILSCATIHFKNKEMSANDDFVIDNKIHHIGLLGLYEYSQPVSPIKICQNKTFRYIETENSLITWAIKWILGGLTAGIGPLFYTPVSVNVACPHIDESKFVFKVISTKGSKAIIKFLSGMPVENSFILPEFNNQEVVILKRKKSKALIKSDKLNLEKTKEYIGSNI